VSRRNIGTKRQNQLAGSLKSQECASRDYGHDGTVCVCNLTHCDTIPRPERVERPQLIVYSSNRAGLRFHRTIQNFTSDAAPQIYINPRKEYQTVLGWGGAFTDSTGININSLDQELQGKLLEVVFWSRRNRVQSVSGADGWYRLFDSCLLVRRRRRGQRVEQLSTGPGRLPVQGSTVEVVVFAPSRVSCRSRTSRRRSICLTMTFN
jgi:hypothetical protein